MLIHLLLLCGGIFCAERNHAFVVSFDSPCVATPYKKMLDLSMQIVSGLIVLSQYHHRDHTFTILCDNLVGRLIRLGAAITVLTTGKKRSALILRSDIEYMACIVDRILIAYNAIVPMQEYPLISTVLAQAHKQLDQLLEHAS